MGMRPVFMPKPLYEMNGSGLHLHISLWRDDKNLFYNTNGLSDVARYFIGGLIEHCRSLAAIIAPTTNSYKRLVPGYEAPVYCLWSRYNRSVAIRIPYASDERRVRIEFRPPDPSSNPYLAVSAVILAGLDGINRKIDPGPEFVGNAYKLSQEDVKRNRIMTLPRNLEEALEELENDHDYLKPVFSKDLVESYIEIKREEIREIDKRPSPYEFMLYADI
jgi:glutamine synthetase